MARYAQGVFYPANANKLIGNPTPYYRSSWELTFMQYLDQSSNVLQWGSECLSIPYINPFRPNSKTVYVPDFLIVVNRNGKRSGEVIEIKPASEAIAEHAKTKKNKAALIVNTAKWIAAQAFCKSNGLTFRVFTQEQLYIQTGSQIKKKKK